MLNFETQTDAHQAFLHHSPKVGQGYSDIGPTTMEQGPIKRFVVPGNPLGWVVGEDAQKTLQGDRIYRFGKPIRREREAVVVLTTSHKAGRDGESGYQKTYGGLEVDVC